SVGAMARGVLSRGVVGPDKLGHVTPRLRNCTSRNSSRADLTPGKVEHSERCPGQTVTLRIIFSGGGSPHCEAKPSSAGRRLPPLSALSRSLSDQCSCTVPQGSVQ